MLKSLLKRLRWRARPEGLVLANIAGTPVDLDEDVAIYFRDAGITVAIAERTNLQGDTLSVLHFAVSSKVRGRGAGRLALLTLASHLETTVPAIERIDLHLSAQQGRVDPIKLRDDRVALLRWLGVPQDSINISPKPGPNAGHWSVQGIWEKAQWKTEARLPQALAYYRAGDGV